MCFVLFCFGERGDACSPSHPLTAFVLGRRGGERKGEETARCVCFVGMDGMEVRRLPHATSPPLRLGQAEKRRARRPRHLADRFLHFLYFDKGDGSRRMDRRKGGRKEGRIILFVG